MEVCETLSRNVAGAYHVNPSSLKVTVLEANGCRDTLAAAIGSTFISEKTNNDLLVV